MVIVHVINLDVVGGVERLYSNFINHRPMGFEVVHHTLTYSSRITPILQTRVEAGSKTISYGKHYKGIKIPKYPSILRDIHRGHILKAIQPNIVLLWSKVNQLNLDLIPAVTKVIYYEHGKAWFPNVDPEMQKYLERVSGIICNSYAAKRVLELRWKVDHRVPIDICPNAVRPDCMPKQPVVKQFDGSRPFRLGFAGRLIPLKGTVLLIHALYELRKRGVRAELNIAGDGPDRAKLLKMADKFELQGQIKFWGLMEDISEFYRYIDCLVMPSIREAFGLAAAEAMAYGCPAIVAYVDGLAEVIKEGETGLSLEPSLSINAYEALGGGRDGLPKFVFNPAAEQIEKPKALSPQVIADAVQKLSGCPELYNEMSFKASKAAWEKFDFDHYVNRMIHYLVRYCE